MTLNKHLEHYIRELALQERADATIQKYAHDVRAFIRWCGEEDSRRLTKEQSLRWRSDLAQKKGACHRQCSRRRGERLSAVYRPDRLLRPPAEGAAHCVS